MFTKIIFDVSNRLIFEDVTNSTPVPVEFLFFKRKDSLIGRVASISLTNHSVEGMSMFAFGHDPRRNHVRLDTFQQWLRLGMLEMNYSQERRLLRHAMDSNLRRLDHAEAIQCLKKGNDGHAARSRINEIFVFSEHSRASS